MSHNNPFFFSAGSGQIPPAQPQQNSTQTSNMQHQTPAAPAQQGSLQQNAELLGMDMSALEGISPEQLAAIARLFQSGALQMPPPAPSVPTQTSPTAPSAPTSVQAPSSVPQASQAQATTTMREDVEMDTEEGEVNESEEGSTPAKIRDFLRPPPTGPRNRSMSPRDRVRSKLKHRSSPRPPMPTPAVSKQSPSQNTQTSQASGVTNGNRAVAKDEAAKMFVLEMVKAGYSYEDIVPDVKNPKSLIRMFRELGLPVPPSQAVSQPTQPNRMAATHRQSQVADVKATPSENAPKASLTKRLAPAKPAPADRSEYLARLQAAKNKKADATAASEPKPGPVERTEYLARLQAAKNKNANTAAAPSAPLEPVPEPEPIERIATPAQGSKQALPSGSGDAGSSSGQPSPVGKSATMTELARQKLEALMAQRAAKHNRNAVSSPTPKLAPTVTNRHVIFSPSQAGLGAGLADIPTQIAQSGVRQRSPLQTVPIGSHALAPAQPAVSPTPQTPSRSFSSLPGLFMFDHTTQPQVPAPPPQSLPTSQAAAQLVSSSTVPQTQSNITSSSFQTAIGTMTASPTPLTMPRKRPVASDFDDAFTKPSSAKRPFGQSRNASEDESLVIQVSDEEDEYDEMEAEPLPGPSAQTRLQTKSFRDVGPLRDFPPKPNFQAQTSAPSTPGGVTYEQKIKQIEEIKRMIAEKEKRQKSNGKGAVSKPEGSGGMTGSSAVSTALLDESSISTPDSGSMSNIQSRPLPVETSPLDSFPHPMPQTGVSVHSRSASAERPMSATQLAKQQEKERLRKRLLELEQEEVEDVNEAVEAAVTAADPEHAMSAALPDAPPPLEHNEESQPQTYQENTAAERNVSGSASEEGELTDDSMSKFYNPQDGQDNKSQFVSSVDDSKVDSQATTVSARSQTETVTALNSQLYNTLNQDSTIARVSSSQPSMMTAAEYQVPDAQIEDVEMNDNPRDPARAVVQDNLATPESLAEDEMGEDSNEDDSDLDNVPGGPTYTPHEGLVSGRSSQDDTSGEDDLEGQESASRASSAEPVNVDAAREPFILQAGHVDKDNGVIADDDLAPKLQPSNDEQAVIPDQNPVKSKSYFTPYRSPLAGFKDYRYHPEYLNTVAGGYKSITYSHNIDPKNALCPFETAGGKCNDTTCQNQHFKSMVVSDNELLKTMGTKDVPARNPDELKKWNEGLGAVVRELRNTNLGKDADAIAARIAEFRREFVGDPTKILNLG